MICIIPPTSVKCSTVGWWHSNSIFSEVRYSIWPSSHHPWRIWRIHLLQVWKLLECFNPRHLSLWIIADQPDCRSTHISGVFSSSPSTLSSGKIQNHICPAISPSFAFFYLPLYFPGPSSCTFIFSRSLFVYIAIFQVTLLVRWDRSFGRWEPSSRAFQQHQAEWRHPHLCQGFHLSRSSKWCNGEKSNRSKQCGDFVFVFLIVNFTLVRGLYLPARRSFWELWRCQSEPP